MDWWSNWRLCRRKPTDMRSGLLFKFYINMEIYLVRHTNVEVPFGTCYGWSDVSLTDDFLKDAQIITDSLPKQIDKVYSSPLLRCKSLAFLINPHYTIDDRLKELNFGDWEMKNWNQVSKNELWFSNYVDCCPPSGESFRQLFNRACETLEEIIRSEHRIIVLVTHGGIIRALIAKILGLSLEQSIKLNIPFSSIHKFIL
jgi:alpha-ribazole phosphatase